jgi:NRAMP (natural resistance-associated macrophage protein)-like metal ion transporter
MESCAYEVCKIISGPGALISVAYVDPDNYQTALDAGAYFQFKLLFITLVGVLITILLQVSSNLSSMIRC